MSKATLRCAIDRLADLWEQESKKPSPDWKAFAPQAIAQLSPPQRHEIIRANDMAFSMAFARAITQKLQDGCKGRRPN